MTKGLGGVVVVVGDGGDGALGLGFARLTVNVGRLVVLSVGIG